jgi:hypothetical protein
MSPSPMSQSMVPPGTLKRAVIVSVNPTQGTMSVKLDTAAVSIPNNSQTSRIVQVSFPYYSVDGIFVGGYPAAGTPVIVGQGESTTWYFVSFLVSNLITLPDFNPGEFLIQSDDNTKISINTDEEISIGNMLTSLYFNTSSTLQNNKIQSSYSNSFAFTQGTRSSTGIIKREVLQPASIFDYQKLTSDDYDTHLTPISLDPTSTTVVYSQSATKNPPFVEKREMVYEFAYASQVQDDITEAAIYSLNQQQPPPVTPYTLPNRRYSKTDTLSLSLVAPNYLMETTKGTVVDIFGNVLDINRQPIVGYSQEQQSLTINTQSSKSVAFDNIKQAERKSIAYHFELNARKDLSAGNGQFQLPNINSSADNARPRSRMFFDLDKEGQFNLNVPASSETGNVPLLTRYENYSTFGPEDNNNPNKLIFREDYLDIFCDSYSTQDITINNSTGVATPVDRLTGNNIMLGTPFHSILNSAYAFSPANTQPLLNYQYPSLYPGRNTTIDITTIPTLTNPVSDTITTDGYNANAGGRSGTANFDGSLAVSIGANTIDRQSIWMDTAGSAIMNLGRDLNNNSLVASMDGYCLLQIGGYGVGGNPAAPNAVDSRFATVNNGWIGGALDIRVLNDGFTATMIRVGSAGIEILCPSAITIHGRDIVLESNGNLLLNGDNVYIQNRWVNPLGNSI